MIYTRSSNELKIGALFIHACRGEDYIFQKLPVIRVKQPGGRNTIVKIAADATDPLKAIRDNVNAYRPALLKEGMFTVVLGRSTQKTTQETTQKTEDRILKILKNNPQASRSEIAATLGDITENGVKYQLNSLRKKGKIERIGPDKGGYWKVLNS